MASTSDATTSTSSSRDRCDAGQLRRRHSMQREELCLSKQPVQTLKFFLLAVLDYLVMLCRYAAGHKFTFLICLALCFGIWPVLQMVGGYDHIVQESWSYFRFALWWMGLGVASSIGLGSGLHTFVLYLGPHIAMYTFKATLCGREDLKMAPYDTAQFGMSSSWADRDCLSFGPPKYPRLSSEHEQYRVPFYKLLLQVQPEAVLWGIGTALGELPPYFVSRAARLSGERLNGFDDIEQRDSVEDSFPRRIKQWLVAQIERFGFFTILVCASVPNPLFDLAGIMCGQFLVPFWKFFLATVIGKAAIKTHIQTMFIILVCNPHSLELILEFLSWTLSKLPVLSFLLPRVSLALESAQEKFRHGQHVGAKAGQRNWLALAWNTFVTVVLLGFLASIVTSTARSYLLERQLRELQRLEETSKVGQANNNHHNHSEQ